MERYEQWQSPTRVNCARCVRPKENAEKLEPKNPENLRSDIDQNFDRM